MYLFSHVHYSVVHSEDTDTNVGSIKLKDKLLRKLSVYNGMLFSFENERLAL